MVSFYRDRSAGCIPCEGENLQGPARWVTYSYGEALQGVTPLYGEVLQGPVAQVVKPGGPVTSGRQNRQKFLPKPVRLR
jgi:hypothetical protein